MIITRTPFRISFFGGGTDIPAWFSKNGGCVLSTTIDQYLYISLRYMPPLWEFKNRFVYGSKTEYTNNIDEIEHPSIRETLRFLKIEKGIDMHYNTDLPARSGLGSSSSFTVGLLKALYGQTGKIVSDRQLACDAIHIEQNLIQEAVGSQDQAAAAFGGFNRIVFKKNGTFEVNPITLPEEKIKLLNDHLILFYTGQQRYAYTIEEDKIKNVDKNKQNLIQIQQYVDDAISILSNEEDISSFGALLHETWLKKKTLSHKVSNAEIDLIYETGRKNGAIGGKILGAGGGGFILFFVQPSQKHKLCQSLSHLTQIPFHFENTGSQIIYYREGV